MSPSTNEREEILMAHRMGGPPFTLPWASFAEFYRSRLKDPVFAGQVFLTYHDDERGLRRAYTYAEFDAQVRAVAASMQELFGVRRGAALRLSSLIMIRPCLSISQPGF